MGDLENRSQDATMDGATNDEFKEMDDPEGSSSEHVLENEASDSDSAGKNTPRAGATVEFQPSKTDFESGDSSSDESLTALSGGDTHRSRTARERPVTSRPRIKRHSTTDVDQVTESDAAITSDSDTGQDMDHLQDSSSVRQGHTNMEEGQRQSDEDKVINKKETKPGDDDMAEGDDQSETEVNVSMETEELLDDHHANTGGSFMISQPAMSEHFLKFANELKSENDSLLKNHFKDYDRLNDMGELVTKITRICTEFDEYATDVYSSVRVARQAVIDIRSTIDAKINNEGLSSWLAGARALPADKSAVAREKSAVQHAAEARAAAAAAAAELSRMEARTARLEEEAAVAAEDARQAALEAEEAVVKAAEAKKAAEEKARREEEAQRKAEEEKARKQAEEQKRQAEEERRREEEMRLAGTPEEMERRRREMERRDPNNWPSFIYSVEPGSVEIPVGCVLRAMQGTYSREDIQVDRREQTGGTIPLDNNEELVSNIISISRTNPDHNVQLEEPLSVALPHCAPRSVISREPVIKMLQPDGSWHELDTKDVVFEDIKEYKFVEVRLDRPEALLAVVTRTRQETHIVNKRGGKICPAVDSRVCLTFKQATVKVPTHVTVEIQPVDLSSVTDVKYRHPEQCEYLLASSAIMRVSFASNSRLYKSVTVNIPVPPNPSKGRARPGTAAAGSGDHGDKTSGKTRPATALPAAYQKREEADDCVYMLTKANNDEGWTVWSDCPIMQAKNKDMVNWEMTQPVEPRLLVLRVKPDTSDIQVERIANRLEACLRDRAVQIILRQHASDLSMVTVHCTNIHKADRIQRKLAEDLGYSEGPAPSNELIMNEGQEVFLRFRGNIKNASHQEQPLRFVFNSHIKTCLDFTATEIDKFAQKGIDCYRGFVQLYTRGKVARTVTKEEEKNSKSSQKKGTSQRVEMVEDDILLSEMLVCLPKPEPDSPKPIVKRAPVTFLSDGLVNNDMLRYLAVEIGDEWRRLAHHLNIRKVRVQAIIRNNVNKDSDKAIYDMLLTWAKKVPRSMNKVEMLHAALMTCGRADLAEELRDKECDYKEARARMCREAVLEKAFIKVAQNEHVISDWKYLLRHLGINEAQLTELERDNIGMRNRCLGGLKMWQERAGEEATINALIRQLKRCRYYHTADQLEQRR